MVSSTIDHLIAVTVFLAATLLFIGLFNQTIQTAVIYQRHRATATKASDLLDSMLLSPGIPLNWGQTDGVPTGFGLQDPEFTQYKISPFSLMRLSSATGDPVYYYKTGLTYSNITVGSKNFLLVSNTSILDYSSALHLLGINNTYGFQLTMTPIVTVDVTEDPAHPASPLTLSLNVQGTGFPLANAEITCCLVTVSLGGGSPSFNIIYKNGITDDQGMATLTFNEVTNPNLCYSFIAYAHLGGLVGVGYHERVTMEDEYIIPLVQNITDGTVLIAHNFDIQSSDPPSSEVKYNASFVFLAEDFTLRQMALENSAWHVNSGNGFSYEEVTLPDNPGILIITYKKSANEGGVVMMPWGVSALAFPVTFGGDPTTQEWVATDMRQVTVGGIAYRAQIAVWSLEGYQVVG
jgi:hypothetical protein